MFKKLTLMSVLAVVCLYVSAQETPVLKPLTIGDTVPDIVFRHVINYKDSTVSLSDFKGKLVILDFWATTCKGCIYSMPKIDSLQSQFEDKVQFLLVNPKSIQDDIERINKVIGILKRNTGFYVRLPIALFDNVASSYFPFRYLPHCIWIDEKRIVRAITTSQQLTTYNLQAMLKSENFQLPIKNDWQDAP